MSTVIENLFKEKEPIKRYGKIVRPVSAGRYLVEDSQKNLIEVDGDSGWKVGDGVTVSQGRIVASGPNIMNPKVYEV